MLLIFDEVMTGFRLAYGGAQERFRVYGDLVCLGKIIGGGLPVGAFGGKREIMEKLSPDGGIYQAGTLSGNPLAMSAGLATLTLLQQEGFYQRIEEKSAYLEQGLRQAATAAGVATSLQRVGGMFCTFFQAEEVFALADVKPETPQIFAKFFRAMLEEGINLAPSQYEAGFMSIAHSTEDLDRTIAAAHKTFKSL